jgi:hypothetical protein
MTIPRGQLAQLAHFSTDETGNVLPTGGTNPLPVRSTAGGTAGAPATDVVTIQGLAYHPTISFTRPANVTPDYTALDVIGIADAGTPANAGSAIHTLPLAGPSAGSIVIVGAELRIDLAAVPTGMTGFRVHLYDAAPTAILDNAAFDLVANDRGKYLGYIDLGVPIDLGSTLFAEVDGLNKLVKLAAASTSLYAEIQQLGAYTPASATAYTLTLHTLAV